VTWMAHGLPIWILHLQHHCDHVKKKQMSLDAGHSDIKGSNAGGSNARHSNTRCSNAGGSDAGGTSKLKGE